MKDFPVWLKFMIWIVIGSTGVYMLGSIIYALGSMIYAKLVG